MQQSQEAKQKSFLKDMKNFLKLYSAELVFDDGKKSSTFNENKAWLAATKTSHSSFLQTEVEIFLKQIVKQILRSECNKGLLSVFISLPLPCGRYNIFKHQLYISCKSLTNTSGLPLQIES